ncbi:uncharacterized protein YndB with AHSA1/START domain [Sinorhizobium fredii]|jgi:uncharacterized protein YndB with AHSA1/START domain|uniref:Activator of Hsp90 ATPase homologue 1/2-like C-terminal domain-containing protein n=1 Tax=Sinorhizobium fredii (strain USDA 257) TaxID=1185652 RepID=I3XF90_SINF2|nr:MULTISPECIES: SRPBCC family protein [Sinorhizobium]AFL54546.1 hypothetical protein USDA257_c60440 [Sinorhizobium fredii USDA 257]PDT86190.1 vanillate O-demethylase oxidoreductase VanB [Sinorhizobium sp. BJ1]
MKDSIEKRIELAAPIDRVWRALTDHEAFGEWFRVKLDGPFVVGQVTTGEITYPGHEGVKWTSVTERMEAPRLFAFRWPHSEDPDADFSSSPSTRVEFHLKPTTKGTHLTITEAGFGSLPEERREEAVCNNEKGWEIQTQNIKAFVEP